MTAAANKPIASSGAFRKPREATAPAANSSESPGKNGMITNPVSTKTIAIRIAYVTLPWSIVN